MHIPTFYLSEDKVYLMDIQGQNIYSMVQENEYIFYGQIEIESEAYERKCIAIRSIKVCNLWDKATHDCLSFAYVNVCTQWELLPKGYSNIS
jgi:hypothetical protein